MELGIYSRSLDGHRQSYLDFVIDRFGGRRLRASQLIQNRGPVLFLMIEENFMLYFAVALARAMMGKRTVGLLFRPMQAVKGTSLRLGFKRTALTFFKKLSPVKTISVVPLPLAPEISVIVDDWIYDFQLWDLSESQITMIESIRQNGCIESSGLHGFSNTILEFKQDRPLLVALGAQNQNKGTGILADYVKNREIGVAVVVAGRFSDAVESSKRTLEDNGAMVIDRFLSDQELYVLYAHSEFVWCLYHPSYDQASGILGRSIQTGKTPIVRNRSISEALCKLENISHISADDADEVDRNLVSRISSDPAQQMSRQKDVMHRRSMTVLEAVLLSRRTA